MSGKIEQVEVISSVQRQVGAGEEVVPASEYRALHSQVRELQRLLGKKTLENEVLREALDLAQPKKRLLRAASPTRDDTPWRRLPTRSRWRARTWRRRPLRPVVGAAGRRSPRPSC